MSDRNRIRKEKIMELEKKLKKELEENREKGDFPNDYYENHYYTQKTTIIGTLLDINKIVKSYGLSIDDAIEILKIANLNTIAIELAEISKGETKEALIDIACDIDDICLGYMENINK